MEQELRQLHWLRVDEVDVDSEEEERKRKRRKEREEMSRSSRRKRKRKRKRKFPSDRGGKRLREGYGYVTVSLGV
ncbi:hypothetical protein GX48_05068 [Paracoccidioides brasiliensis]|nr:hypothetical protein GX48_05068 [Paracoccidioides brasiliensis]